MANLSARIDDALMARLVEAKSRANLTLTEYVTRVLQFPLDQIRMCQSMLMSVDSPCYFMNERFDIIEVNLAALTVFGLKPQDLPCSLKQFIDETKKKFLNHDQMVKNYKEHFENKPLHKQPPVYDEPADYKHDLFGVIKTTKRAIRVDDAGFRGWVVTYNILSVDKRDVFDREIKNLIAARLL